MNTPGQDTALFLSGLPDFEAFGGSIDWSTYVGREPLEPSNVVTCYDTGGGPGPLNHLRRPTVQVRVRSQLYEEGWRKANIAQQALVQPTEVLVPDARIIGWVLTSDIAFIGRDDHDRALFTVNFEMIREGACIA